VRCIVVQCGTTTPLHCSVLQCVAVCCSVMQCVAVFCSVLQFIAVCCGVLQCAAVCCSVLHCVPFDRINSIWPAPVSVSLIFWFTCECVSSTQEWKNHILITTNRSIPYILVFAGGESIFTDITEHTYFILPKTSRELQYESE